LAKNALLRKLIPKIPIIKISEIHLEILINSEFKKLMNQMKFLCKVRNLGIILLQQ